MRRKYAVMLAAAALAGFAMTAEAADVPQKMALGGKVVSTASAGAEVKEGQVLVSVETLAGPVPAAKATADGRLKEVRVKAGETAEAGTVAAVIETK